MQDKITATVVSQGIASDDDAWDHNAYKVTLHYEGRRMTVPFKTGLGWVREPNAADVIDSLLSDAAGYDNARDFEDWAAEYGYDTDSRKAERVYKAVARQTERLRQLLGDDYDAAVFPVDETSEEVAERLTGISA